MVQSCTRLCFPLKHHNISVVETEAAAAVGLLCKGILMAALRRACLKANELPCLLPYNSLLRYRTIARTEGGSTVSKILVRIGDMLWKSVFKNPMEFLG